MFTKEPQSEWARYAYGYTDKKPGASFWVIHAILVVLAVSNFVRLSE